MLVTAHQHQHNSDKSFKVAVLKNNAISQLLPIMILKGHNGAVNSYVHPSKPQKLLTLNFLALYNVGMQAYQTFLSYFLQPQA